jgi:hypothetical protein
MMKSPGWTHDYSVAAFCLQKGQIELKQSQSFFFILQKRAILLMTF